LDLERIVKDVKINIGNVLNKRNPLEGTFYKKKVFDQMRLHPNSAMPDYHCFPKIVDNYAKYGKIDKIIGKEGISRTRIRLKGSYKKKEGFFEWIIEPDNSINHRLFNIRQ
jgi:hypothetical protein